MARLVMIPYCTSCKPTAQHSTMRGHHVDTAQYGLQCKPEGAISHGVSRRRTNYRHDISAAVRWSGGLNQAQHGTACCASHNHSRRMVQRAAGAAAAHAWCSHVHMCAAAGTRAAQVLSVSQPGAVASHHHSSMGCGCCNNSA